MVSEYDVMAEDQQRRNDEAARRWTPDELDQWWDNRSRAEQESIANAWSSE